MRLYVNSSESLSKEQLAKVSTDPEELAMLANDEDKSIRCYVASNDNCPIDVLEQLSEDADPSVRLYCTHSKNCTPAIIAKLANDDHPWVRQEVVKKTDNSAILKKLSRDLDRYVRKEARSKIKELNIPKGFKNTNWSVPLDSITKYSQIEDEIDEIIDQAANRFAEKNLGSVAIVNSPHGVYDDGGIITIQFASSEGKFDTTVNADDIVVPATSQDDKKDCVRAVLKWMDENF